MGNKQKNVRTNPKRQSIKKVIHTGDPSFYNDKPSWVFRKCDFGHCSWGFCGGKESSSIQELLEKLSGFEGMTWQEIFSAPKGRGIGSKNHTIPVSKLDKEAQDRLNELNLTVDEVVSLRLGGKERIIGFQERAICAIIWHDLNHEVCPIGE